MILTLRRKWFTELSTIGELYVNAAFECFVLEDRYRSSGPKVPGQTAIPIGGYDVAITWSPKFKRDLPLLKSVPGFEGIRIHPGNVAGDTEGCLLPGDERGMNEVRKSIVAFNRLFAKLKAAQDAGNRITLGIMLAPAL